MTPPSTSSPSGGLATTMPSPDGTRDGKNEDKRARILDAAQDRFLRHGVRRTSVDDVAREAGIAKGTIYLYFASKDALFASLAERICADILATACKAARSQAPLTERLVLFLDAYVGAINRLLAHSPHAAELIESKRALAAPVFAAFHIRIEELLRAVLRDEGIVRSAAPRMLLAAAHGTLKTGDISEQPYRARLASLVDTIITGLGKTPDRGCE